MRCDEYLSRAFGTLSDLIELHAGQRGSHAALVSAERTLSYADFEILIERVAGALIRRGVAPRQTVALCAMTSSINYAIAFVGILRAGAVVAPLAPSAQPESLRAMIRDCDAQLLFLDQTVGRALEGQLDLDAVGRVFLDDSEAGQAFSDFVADVPLCPPKVEVGPNDPFNIIYSSGTTGSPKGIVQPHRFRWDQFRRGMYGADAVTLISTPLYSNTTLVSFLPTLAAGGTVILMPKFEVQAFLQLSAVHGATHAMLVPVQYRRLMQDPAFDRYDLSTYRIKFSTSAPFAPDLKAEVLRRWPGGLIEFYGMTEGGGSCMLRVHDFPDKLATVGQPMDGHDIRLIDDTGREVANGETGEVVGRSPSMMEGYHNQPEKTREAEWFSEDGLRFIRTGDIGRFDEDGFLTLIDRKKDMIISGGFNVYPSDLEAELVRHPAVLEAAVFGIASEQWGETPVAAVVLRRDEALDPEALMHWVNARLGKTQRLSDLRLVESLPRSAIGKVLKRDLRASFSGNG